MKEQFTPGPWAVCIDPPNSDWYAGRTVYSVPTNTRVADVSVLRPTYQAKADARLIAAAPDLYEALQTFVRAEKGHGWSECAPDSIERIAIESALAALSKVEIQEQKPDCARETGALTQPAITQTEHLQSELAGALRFILAFYEPGQTYLDTNAWKRAEAAGRIALSKFDSGRVRDESAKSTEPDSQKGFSQ